MTLNQFKQRLISIKPTTSAGQYLVTIEYRGGEKQFKTNNTTAVDRIRFADNYKDSQRESLHTLKEAYCVLWNESKRN